MDAGSREPAKGGGSAQDRGPTADPRATTRAARTRAAAADPGGLDRFIKGMGIAALVLGALATLGALLGVALLDGLATFADAGGYERNDAAFAFAMAGIAYTFATAAALLLAGIGLLQHRAWSRPVGFVAGGLSLVMFPVGTAVGIGLLMLLTRPGIRAALPR